MICKRNEVSQSSEYDIIVSISQNIFENRLKFFGMYSELECLIKNQLF